jgi:sirohydrochlorin ferrochelatase
MARKPSKICKNQFLKELYGEDGFEEIEGDNRHRINGQRAYVLDPTRELTVRHELIADLAAAGLKPAQIGRLVKSNGRTDGGYYASLLRDPRMRERTRNTAVNDVLEKAKEKISSSVTKAAENIYDAVQGGDVKVSQYVLATQGITDKPMTNQTNVNLDFGAWLSGVTNTKTMHDLDRREIDVTADSSALPEAKGLTLTRRNRNDEDD